LRIVVAAIIVLLTTSCASKPPVTAPDWDAIPAGVVEVLCRRLQMDALATGRLTIVGVTQPLATPQSLAALASTQPRRMRNDAAPIASTVNRAIPITTSGTSCTWQTIDVRAMSRYPDAMIVELSAPLANPFNPREAGLFARVSLGNEHPSWYWIPLTPTGNGWAPGFVLVLFR
jgi:hypothetical protein